MWKIQSGDSLNTYISRTKHRSLHSRGLRDLLERGMNAVVLRRTSYGLRRHLHTSCLPPTTKLPLMVRELNHSDTPLILPYHLAASDRREGQQINQRRKLLAQNIPTPFVAIDQSSSRPCFIQWAFDSSHNDFITHFFKGRFPRLKQGEVLLENAYTHPHYRGQGVMPVAMSLIADIIAARGAREVMTFVETTNIPSLKGCTRAGFQPFMIRKDLSLCGGIKRYRTFNPIPPNTEIDFLNQPVSLLGTIHS